MKVIPPLTIVDAMLTSSTAAEPGAGETLWNVGTAYTVGQTCYLATTHRRYECLVAHTGASPDVNLTGATPKWLELGPTNRWACFDLYRNTATVQASPLTVVLTPGVRVGAMALMGLVGDSVTVSMTVSAVTVYSRTVNIINRSTIDWTGYFFGTFGNRPSVILFDLPMYSNGVITIAIARASGSVSCGAIVIGNAADLGRAEAQASRDSLNFSTVSRDTFGNATLVPRRTVPRTSQTLLTEKAKVNTLLDLVVSLNAVPAVWSALDDQTESDYFEAMLILGIYKEFSINVAYPDYAKVNLQLEEI